MSPRRPLPNLLWVLSGNLVLACVPAARPMSQASGGWGVCVSSLETPLHLQLLAGPLPLRQPLIIPDVPQAENSWPMWPKRQDRRCPGSCVGQTTPDSFHSGISDPSGSLPPARTTSHLGAGPKDRLLQLPPFPFCSLPPSSPSSRVREWVWGGEGTGWGAAAARWHLFLYIFCLLLELYLLSLETNNLLTLFSGLDLGIDLGTGDPLFMIQRDCG